MSAETAVGGAAPSARTVADCGRTATAAFGSTIGATVGATSGASIGGTGGAESGGGGAAATEACAGNGETGAAGAGANTALGSCIAGAVDRVCGADTPFPLAFEKLYLPDELKVYDAIKKTVEF